MPIVSADLEIGPRKFPLVSGYRLNFCADPKCGPHLFLLDRNGDAFAEFIMSAEQVSEIEHRTMEHIAGIPK